MHLGGGSTEVWVRWFVPPRPVRTFTEGEMGSSLLPEQLFEQLDAAQDVFDTCDDPLRFRQFAFANYPPPGSWGCRWRRRRLSGFVERGRNPR